MLCGPFLSEARIPYLSLRNTAPQALDSISGSFLTVGISSVGRCFFTLRKEDCETDVNFGLACGEHGVAVTGSCVCDAGYEGEDCSECSPEHVRVAALIQQRLHRRVRT